jgi:hypothetical protein
MMRRITAGLRITAAVAAVAAVSAFGPAQAAGWGKAEEVPGAATLNTGQAQVNAVSCASAGNCSAGGWYTDSAGQGQAFVVSEKSGTWDTMLEVPGITTISKDGFASVDVIACASAGNCSAGGTYTVGGSAGHPVQQVFVTDEVGGTWRTAIQLPGTQALVGPASGALTAMACPSAGSCAVSGYYPNASGDQQAIVASEVNGAWGKAEDVPGTVSLNQGGQAWTNSVSCASVGNCSAGGFYSQANGFEPAFVVSEKSGTWGNAEPVPGLSALNKGGFAQVSSVSCASAGNCSAGGHYTDGAGNQEAFGVTQTSGTWGSALEIPGIGSLNKGLFADVGSLSCRSPGNCSGGGTYSPSRIGLSSFVVSQTNGTWGTAEEVPGMAGLNAGQTGELLSLSCGAVGDCSAGGYYESSPAGLGPQQAYVVSESGGKWGNAEEVPGTASFNSGGFAATTSVSCPSAGHCGAGGWYSSSISVSEPFVVSRS